MPYEHMPDPRPANVRVALGNLSRRAAWAVFALWVLAAGVAWTSAWYDRSHVAAWGTAGLAAILLAGNSVVAIRWANQHRAWPYRRQARRQAAPTQPTARQHRTADGRPADAV